MKEELELYKALVQTQAIALEKQTAVIAFQDKKIISLTKN